MASKLSPPLAALSRRIQTALRQRELYTCEAVSAALTREEALRLPNMGRKDVDELEAAMAAEGWGWRDEGRIVLARMRVAVWPDATWSGCGASQVYLDGWKEDLDTAVMVMAWSRAAEPQWAWATVRVPVPQRREELELVGVVDVE